MARSSVVKVPGVLFLPDLGYDDRIWADIPVGLDLDLDPGLIAMTDRCCPVMVGRAAARVHELRLFGTRGRES